MLYSPVVLENHAGCDSNAKRALQVARERPGYSLQLQQLVSGLSSYARKEERKFIHLVDGGITDNLGLLAFQESIDVAGGAQAFLEHVGGAVAPRLAVISVNASTNSGAAIDASSFSPTLEQTVNAVADIQLHRSNTATLALFARSMKRWALDVSTPEQPVEPYFVQVELQAVAEPEQRAQLQSIPTTFSLDSLQVDGLIAAGRQLLRENPEFVRFRGDLANPK